MDIRKLRLSCLYLAVDRKPLIRKCPLSTEYVHEVLWENIIFLLKNKEKTLTDLTKVTGLTHKDLRTPGKLQKYIITLDFIVKLCNLFEVTPAELVRINSNTESKYNYRRTYRNYKW